MAEPLRGTERLCVHTMTTKPWSLAEALQGYGRVGVRGITVWRQHLDGLALSEARMMLDDSGLTVVSLCRGGFFPAETEVGRQAAIDDNRKAIDEAHEIGAPLVVLVCGAVPGIPLAEARRQIADGIASVVDHAAGAGVRLSIEPLHPMYADSRSAVNTIAQACELCETLASPWVGVTIDVYHLWWDPHLRAGIQRAGRSILSYHVCDWRTPTVDLLNDRGLMGEGCIPLREIRGWVEETEFDGFIEVEIFSNRLWAGDQAAYMAHIREAWLTHC